MHFTWRNNPCDGFIGINNVFMANRRIRRAEIPTRNGEIAI